MKIESIRYDSESQWYRFTQADEADTFPVRIISLGHMSATSPHRMLDKEYMTRMNRQKFHSFQYLMKGTGRFCYGRKSQRILRDINPGSFFVMSHNLNFTFEYTSGGPWEWLWIVVAGELADRTFSTAGHEERVFELPGETAPVQTLHTLLQRVFLTPMTTNEMISYGCLFLLRFKDAVLESRRSPCEALLAKSIQTVRDHIRSINVKQLAKSHGYSVPYFHRYFYQMTGVTPGNFIQRQRIAHAEMLLKNTKKKLIEIADASGFSDASHLCRLFRKHHGISPHVWKNKSENHAIF